MTPKERVEAECLRRGRAAVVAGCAQLVAGDYEDVGLIVALAPNGSAKYFDGRVHHDDYWFRVWGMRGLLWAWEDSATPAVHVGARDEHWRVREMTAKVVARHVVGAGFTDVERLRSDPVPRVRAAAERAVTALAAAGA